MNNSSYFGYLATRMPVAIVLLAVFTPIFPYLILGLLGGALLLAYEGILWLDQYSEYLTYRNVLVLYAILFTLGMLKGIYYQLNPSVEADEQDEYLETVRERNRHTMREHEAQRDSAREQRRVFEVQRARAQRRRKFPKPGRDA